jgi:hypothetical protein
MADDFAWFKRNPDRYYRARLATFGSDGSSWQFEAACRMTLSRLKGPSTRQVRSMSSLSLPNCSGSYFAASRTARAFSTEMRKVWLCRVGASSRYAQILFGLQAEGLTFE